MGTLEAEVHTAMRERGLAPENADQTARILRLAGYEIGTSKPFKYKEPLSTDQARAVRTALDKFLQS